MYINYNMIKKKTKLMFTYNNHKEAENLDVIRVCLSKLSLHLNISPTRYTIYLCFQSTKQNPSFLCDLQGWIFYTKKG